MPNPSPFTIQPQPKVIPVTVKLSCGCSFTFPATDQTLPRENDTLRCYHCEKDVAVIKVKVL